MAPPPVPDWLVPWSVWMIRGKVDPRPAGVPSRIPGWAIWFPAWVKWRSGGKVGVRPAKAPMPVPRWVWAPAAEVIREVNKEASLEFWRRMGVWVTNPHHISPDQLESLGAGRYGYVVVPTLFGTTMESSTTDGLADFIVRVRARGFDVVGSQWGAATTVGAAQAEADAGVDALKAFGFDGWCINGEKLYEGGGRSGAYARRFRLRVGFAVPLLWSPEPRLDLDHAVLQEMGAAYAPQAYPLENRSDVNYVAEWGRNFGYLKANTIPLVQGYAAPDGSRYPATQHRDQARANGLPGLVLYTGNQTVGLPQYWRDLVVT